MKILMRHGSGGEDTRRLIEDLFMKNFQNCWSSPMEDAAVLPVPKSGRIAFTTDSYVVEPLFFPGGDIGRLAVCGTVNDLLTSGAKPLYLSAGFILEEGLELDTLGRVVRSMASTAAEAGVCIVTGDTKVIEGKGGMYINTAGVGAASAQSVTTASVQPGDVILVSGTLGDHHACIVSGRMKISNSIQSDAAPLCEMISALQTHNIPISGLRDITRGGLATVLHEIAEKQNLQARLTESALPVSEAVSGLCSILGLDPLYMGNEGNMLIFVAESYAKEALSLVRQSKYGNHAAIVGQLVTKDKKTAPHLVLETKLGALRILPTLTGEGLPRIC